MKKVFALLAAGAVSMSMLAFAGCGDSSDGVINGNYTEKTPEELEEIVDGIDEDKIFGGNEDGTPNLNLGLKVNLSGSFSMGDTMSGSVSTDLNFKLASNENGFVGTGSGSLKTSYTTSVEDVTMKTSAEYKGTAYLENYIAYLGATGSSTTSAAGQSQEHKIDQKIKINLLEVIENVGGNDGSVDVPSLDDSDLSLSDLLALAQQYGVKVTVDDKDGVKFKLSATEDTVWALVETFTSVSLTEEGLAAIKESVTFNKFQFDLYFALDKDGAFSGTSAVVDIDVKVDTSLFGMLFEESSEAPVLSVAVKGSVEIYTHNDKVSVPSGLAEDEKYFDYTDMIFDLIGNYI